MREVFIDLSPDSHLQEVKVFGGYSGEQNETLLKIKLPERMISNDFLYYYFKFETDCNEEILSVPIPYTEITNSIIETPLWQQLTKNGFLKVNVVASNGIITESPSRIAMTNTIVLAIKKSPNGQKVFIDPNAVELQLLQLIDERVLRDLQNLGELVVDQTYTPTSPNAQSGIATAKAVGVANDYTDKAIKSSKNYANNTFAPAIKNTVSGSVLAVHDVSPVEHDLGVKVRGKNLFDINGFINLTSNSTYYGINDNGELYVKQSDFRDDTVIPAFVTLEAGTYTLSSTTAITSSFKLINLTDNKTIAFNNNVTFSIEKVTSLGVKCWQSANTVIGKFQLELGTTATDYTPYVADLSAVGVSRLGKNLFNVGESEDYFVGDSILNIENNTISGQIRDSAIARAFKLTNYPSGDYSVSFDVTQNSISILIRMFDSNGTQLSSSDVTFSGTYNAFYGGWITNNNSANFTIPDTVDYWQLGFVFTGTSFQYATATNIQLEKGLNITSYEPYEAQTVVANADGIVEGLTSISPDMTVTTDTEGVVIDMTYNADTKMYIDNKISELL